ncbi:serine/arginine-rich splicing factor 11-like [Alligator sinensis]|uniref:Serine/arginine-rich splicing factor 11-like n=1 Tax=Alligator sinensis TaxID=38654 RepID=A0A3Q0H969_ALLSI|nr:serine/arginine-rich splicing factor 11-like [Alligator sinensis]
MAAKKPDRKFFLGPGQGRSPEGPGAWSRLQGTGRGSGCLRHPRRGPGPGVPHGASRCCRAARGGAKSRGVLERTSRALRRDPWEDKRKRRRPNPPRSPRRNYLRAPRSPKRTLPSPPKNPRSLPKPPRSHRGKKKPEATPPVQPEKEEKDRYYQPEDPLFPPPAREEDDYGVAEPSRLPSPYDEEERSQVYGERDRGKPHWLTSWITYHCIHIACTHPILTHSLPPPRHPRGARDSGCAGQSCPEKVQSAAISLMALKHRVRRGALLRLPWA